MSASRRPYDVGTLPHFAVGEIEAQRPRVQGHRAVKQRGRDRKPRLFPAGLLRFSGARPRMLRGMPV